MAISFNEATAGSLFNRLDKIKDIFHQIRGDLRTGGTYHALFILLCDVLAGGDITPSGDITDERDLQRFAEAIFLKVQEAVYRTACLPLKALSQELVRRHLARDTGAYDLGQLVSDFLSGPDKDIGPELRELERQLLAAVETVQRCAVTVTATAGSTNVGGGVNVAIITTTKRGDGLTVPHIGPSKGKAWCRQSFYDERGFLNHEEFVYQDASGPPDGSHPDWSEGTRGIRRGPASDVVFRVVDPTAYAKRGNILCNSNFNDGWAVDGADYHPARWVRTAGTPGTDYRRGTTVFYDSSTEIPSTYSLELLSTGTNVFGFKQVFGNDSGTPLRLLANSVLGFAVRLRPGSSLSGGVLRFAITDANGSVINDDQGNALSLSVTLSGLTLASWNTQTAVFAIPRRVLNNYEFRIDLTSDIVGDSCFVAAMALTEMWEAYPGGWRGAVIAGDKPFISANKKRRTPDFVDFTGTNDNGGLTHRRATWQGFHLGILDADKYGTIWNETSGTATPTIAD